MACLNADHHLLFGLLALQNGLINQGQLVAAFQAWSLEKSRSLADHLMTLGHLSSAQRSVVEALAALHVSAHGGAVEKSLAALDLGRSMRERLDSLDDPDVNRTLDHVVSCRTSTDDDRTASYDVGAVTSDGLRFRVLRPHARGGLGAVFVALDTELHREVALKQILDHHADDPAKRQRFLIEAEITGGLEHPGIVPVYGLGSFADGRPYYAMRFIRGGSLKQSIDSFHADESLKNEPGRRSLEIRSLLRRFTDVCNAIDYAHSRGVLHRDLKPGNIIVGKYGETLVVDWGLAKATGKAELGGDERTLMPNSASGSAVTLAGGVLGTPSYMSPEQARGDLDCLGPRSDVYSLGATLYCLFTGKPPFGGNDQGDILRAVESGDFVRPREVNPSLDAALEAVCLKAMSKQPESRYPSCRALADDLDRWMAEEPVTAWREPLSRRARRWAQRNRTAVTAASVLLVSAVVGLSLGTALLGKANSEIQKQRDLARGNLRKAEQAVDEYFTKISENALLKSPLPGLQPLRRELLGTALRYYQEFTAQTVADAASRAELARAYFRMGSITSAVGSKGEAIQHLTRAGAIWENLLEERRGDRLYREQLAQDLVSIASIQSSELGQAAEALRNLEQARSLYEALAGESPQKVDYQAGLAETHRELGSWYFRHQRGEDEAREHHKSYEIFTRLSAIAPRYRLDAARSAMALGFWNTRQRRTDEALRNHAEARRILEALSREQPDDLALQDDMARVYINMGYTNHQAGRYQEALAAYEPGLAMRARLARENPRVTSYQLGWAGVQVQIGYALRDMRLLDRAIESCRGAIAVAENALSHFASDSYQLQITVVESYALMAACEYAAGRFDRADDAFTEGIRRCKSVRPEERHDAHLQFSLGSLHKGYGILLAKIGKLDDAIRSFQAAIEVLEPSGQAPRGDLIAIYVLARSYENLGMVYRRLGRLADAEASYRAAVDKFDAIIRLSSGADEDRIQRTLALATLADTQRALERRADAIRSLEDAQSNLGAVQTHQAEMLFARARIELLVSRLRQTGGADGRPPDRVMDLLRQAGAAGFRDLDLMRTDPVLDSLRSRADFELLMMDLAFPTEPFVE